MYNPGFSSKPLFEDASHSGGAIDDIRYPEYFISLLTEKNQAPLTCEGYTSNPLSQTDTSLPQI
ncbi:hypothetical protein [Endozoicomonas numazuensis]|uniref:Uncharacterized protein n=1 Tax=Endozoicomonas numazuensis TaxID=1137799 RepID=A0A081NJK5_9GAMM|nr:hypothetical protein [Endozoicomonas numazuensis]KEQ18628.1 hypothetical protein GZ78_00360 [Endozoicomonas numazuensis]